MTTTEYRAPRQRAPTRFQQPAAAYNSRKRNKTDRDRDRAYSPVHCTFFSGFFPPWRSTTAFNLSFSFFTFKFPINLAPLSLSLSLCSRSASDPHISWFLVLFTLTIIRAESLVQNVAISNFMEIGRIFESVFPFLPFFHYRRNISEISRFTLSRDRVNYVIARLVVPEVYHVRDSEPCGAFQRIDRLSFALLPHNRKVLLQENRMLRM